VRIPLTIRETRLLYINRKSHPANAKIGESPSATGKRPATPENADSRNQFDPAKEN
jgi:hypothetical protein